MNLKSKKGFTLVELIIVIAILGIIALIAVPSLTGIQKRSQVNADDRTAETIAKALTICITEDRAVSASVDATGYLNTKLKNNWYNLNEIEAEIFGDPDDVEVDFDQYVDTSLKPKSASTTGTDAGTGAYIVRYVTEDGSGNLLPVPRVVVAIAKGTATQMKSAQTLDLSGLPYDSEFSDKNYMIACINGVELSAANIATYDLK